MDGLKQVGIERDTLIVFTGDNGPYPHLAGRTLRLRGCKFSLYEGGIREPLIVRWPGVVPAGAVDRKSVIASIDMFPTLCRIAAADLPVGVRFDGVDMSAALRGEPAIAGSRTLFWEYGRNEKFFGYPRQAEDRSPRLAVRDGHWKLLINPDGSGEELYDLEKDESEKHNVADDNPDVASRLGVKVLQWRGSIP